MEMELQPRGIAIGQPLRNLIARHIESALGRFAHRILNVTVQLADTNGQRGGIDKHCHIAVRLSDGKMIRAKDLNTHVLAAFYYAADRVAYAVSRELGRQRKLARRRRSGELEIE